MQIVRYRNEDGEHICFGIRIDQHEYTYWEDGTVPDGPFVYGTLREDPYFQCCESSKLELLITTGKTPYGIIEEYKTVLEHSIKESKAAEAFLDALIE